MHGILLIGRNNMLFKNIVFETDKIIKKGWTKSLYNGTGGLGITFEKLLNIETNKFEIPDYGEIEIKTKLYNRPGYISLFNATPDSYLFEIKRIQETYGYPDSRNKKYKVFNISFYANKKIYIGKNLYAMLKIDREKQKIFLLIMDRQYNIIDSDSSWSFELLEEKINRKLKNLFLVFGEKRNVDNVTYYKYLKYECYAFKDFKAFLNSLENGEIRISFKIGVIRTGPKQGKICDHGTSFDIDISKIEKIYNKI